MTEVNAIILAAGLSTRMGAQNKLLLELDGTPLVARVVRAYASAVTGTIHVITGFEAERVSAALRDLPVEILHNPRFEEGQQTSVVAGLSHLADDTPTILGLGDQPLLSADDLRWLIARHENVPSKITIPQDGTGARGNPIVIPSHLRGQMLASPKSPGCRKFTRENPELVDMVESPSFGFFADIDTPEDYARFEPQTLASEGGHP